VNLEGLRNPNYWREFYEHVQAQVQRIMEMLNELGAISEKTKPIFHDKVQWKEVLDAALCKMKADLDAKKIRVDNKVSASLPALLVDGKIPAHFSICLLKDEAISLPEGSVVTITLNRLSIPL